VVDQLSGAGGPAEAESIETFMPRFADMCRAKDELLAALVDGGGSVQHGRVGDAEVVQDALDRARASPSVVAFRFAWLWPAAGCEVIVAPDCGPGERENVAWRPDVGCDRGDGAGRLGTCDSCVVVGDEQGLDSVWRCWREGMGDVEAVGEASRGYEQPPGLSGGLDLLVVG